MTMARKLCWILVTANVIFFLWAYYGRHGGPPTLSQVPLAPVERLVLLNERPPEGEYSDSVPSSRSETGTSSEEAQTAERESDSETEGDTDRTVDVDPRCYRIGPFARTEDADAFVEKAGVKGRIEAEENASVEGFWLMYPPAETLSAGRRNLERLRTQGLQDLWLFEEGPWKGAISLGMYSQLSRAKTVSDQLRERGIEVTVMPRRKITTTRYWVRMERSLSPQWLEAVPAGVKAVPCRSQ
ncbi:hypothetical protein [Methylohalobius crimeensis]|uniref:hypothetical protein n=1 Tax=Methylohalobius crimeensis TaxID=244365 RepID=UPI0003B349A0|nr:hypothetical protein [Methylohalobius crimeensis]